MKVSLDISAPSPLWRGLPRARAIARETIAAATAESGAALSIDRPEGRASFQTPYGVVVSLCLADDAALRALNARWRGIDKPTNVLSFPVYKNFSFSLGTLDSYLNNPPASVPPTKRNSFQFTMGLTYAFKSQY